jgi:hypothetical protein
MGGYDHTQGSTVQWMVVALGLVLAGIGVHPFELPDLLFGALLALIGAPFAHLRVWDEGPVLRARFGPIPLFGTDIPHEGIESVKVVRVRGFVWRGMHGTPGISLGLLLSGSRAVALNMKTGGTWRYPRYLIGTDEPEALAEFVA